jgi:glutaminyl-tRNA synthetase
MNSIVDMVVLENSIREELNKTAQRVMGVFDPLKVVITNYPEGKIEDLDAINNPEDASMGSRKVPFSGIIYIERKDFMEEPPRKFFRLSPGREVRLRYAYFITCQEVIKDKDGKVVELRCTYDPATKGGDSPDGRKVRGTLHWVSACTAVEAEARLYEPLFTERDPNDVEQGGDYKNNLNPSSLQVLDPVYVEPFLTGTEPGKRLQFERTGYFCVDEKDSVPGKPVLNRIVTLKDTWAKIQKSMKKGK